MVRKIRTPSDLEALRRAILNKRDSDPRSHLKRGGIVDKVCRKYHKEDSMVDMRSEI